MSRDTGGRAPLDVPTEPFLAAFIRDQILESAVGQVDVLPPASECMRVRRVAKVSVAAALGVQPGHMLHVGEPDAAPINVDPQGFGTLEPVRKLIFYAPDGWRLDARVRGLPIGAEFEPTPAFIGARYRQDPSPRALYQLWKQEEWTDLEALAWHTLTRADALVSKLTGGLVGRFLGVDEIKVRDHPALLFHGAALAEQGRYREGMAEVAEFMSQYTAGWPPLYGAIARYYAGVASARKNRVERALEHWEQAWATEPLQQVAEAIASVGHERPDAPRWYGEVLPNYDLWTVDRAENALLYHTLDLLPDHQLQVVCMMGGFRGNFSYNRFMRRYYNYAAFFEPFLAPLHVITTQTERVGSPSYFEAEDELRASGIGMLVLNDVNAYVQFAVKPRRVPTVYVVDKAGIVVHEGHLDSLDLWDALLYAGALRLQRTPVAPTDGTGR